MDAEQDRKRIHTRIDYLLAHEDEQTWDERTGHFGDYEEWTSLMALRRELKFIEYSEEIDKMTVDLLKKNSPKPD